MENFECIIAFVTAGYSTIVMDAAREKGARGGTIIHARGSATKEMETKFGVAITPDKEMIMILVNKDIKDDVLRAIYDVANFDTIGNGIAFSVPVNDVAGIGINPNNK